MLFILLFLCYNKINYNSYQLRRKLSCPELSRKKSPVPPAASSISPEHHAARSGLLRAAFPFFRQKGTASGRCGSLLEQVRGIEPPYAAWEAAVLPMNYTCILTCEFIITDFRLEFNRFFSHLLSVYFNR